MHTHQSGSKTYVLSLYPHCLCKGMTKLEEQAQLPPPEKQQQLLECPTPHPLLQKGGEKEQVNELGIVLSSVPHFPTMTSCYSLTFKDSGMLLAKDLHKVSSFWDSCSIAIWWGTSVLELAKEKLKRLRVKGEGECLGTKRIKNALYTYSPSNPSTGFIIILILKTSKLRKTR